MLEPNVVFAPDEGSGGDPSEAEGETVDGEQSIEEAVAELAGKVAQLSGDRDGTYSRLDKTDNALQSIQDSLETLTSKLGETAQPQDSGLVDLIAQLGEKVEQISQKPEPEKDEGGLVAAQQLVSALGLDMNDAQVLQAVQKHSDMGELSAALVAYKNSSVSQASPAEVPQGGGGGQAPIKPASGETMTETQYQDGLRKIIGDIPYTDMDARHKAIAAWKREANSKGLSKV